MHSVQVSCKAEFLKVRRKNLVHNFWLTTVLPFNPIQPRRFWGLLRGLEIDILIDNCNRANRANRAKISQDNSRFLLVKKGGKSIYLNYFLNRFGSIWINLDHEMDTFLRIRQSKI